MSYCDEKWRLVGLNVTCGGSKSGFFVSLLKIYLWVNCMGDPHLFSLNWNESECFWSRRNSGCFWECVLFVSVLCIWPPTVPPSPKKIIIWYSQKELLVTDMVVILILQYFIQANYNLYTHSNCFSINSMPSILQKM